MEKSKSGDIIISVMTNLFIWGLYSCQSRMGSGIQDCQCPLVCSSHSFSLWVWARPHQHKYQVVRRARKWLEFLQPYPINLEDEVITMFKGLWALLLKLVVCPESKRQKLKDKIETLLKAFSISNNLRFGRDPSFWISIFFLLTCRFI